MSPTSTPPDALRKQLWLGHLPLADRVVAEFCHRRDLKEDASQEVKLALWEASAKWDASVQETFNHYAWLVMRRKLLYFLTAKASERPRLSRREQHVMNSIREALAAGQMISAKTIDAISAESGIDRFRLTQLVSFWYSTRFTITAQSMSHIAELASPEDAEDLSKELEILEECMGMLPEREQKIIAERFMRDPRATLGDLSSVLGVSIERVRQLEANSLKKLRKMLSDKIG